MKTIKLNFLECIPTEIELDEDRETDPCFDLSDSSLFCVHCNQNFTNKRQIQDHVREFHKNTVYKKDRRKFTRYQCKICSKHFADSWTLKHHNKTVHLAVRDHACELCSKCFLSTKDLKRHVDGVHLKKRILYPGAVRKAKEAQEGSEKVERRGRKKKHTNENDKSYDVDEVIDFKDNIIIEEQLPFSKSNVENSYKSGKDNGAGCSSQTRNTDTPGNTPSPVVSSRHPLPLEDFRKVMTPAFSRKSLNEQKRWNLEEIVHNIKVSESGSNHAIVPVIGAQQQSADLQSRDLVMSADPETRDRVRSADPESRYRVKAALPRRRNRKHKTASNQNDKEFKETKTTSTKDEFRSADKLDALAVLSRDEESRGLPEQLPMFQLDQLDNLPIILPEFTQTQHHIQHSQHQHSQTQQHIHDSQTDSYENNKVLLDNENRTEMDDIQIIKLTNSEETGLSEFTTDETMCYFTQISSDQVSLMDTGKDIGEEENIHTEKDASGNIIYRLAPQSGNLVLPSLPGNLGLSSLTDNLVMTSTSANFSMATIPGNFSVSSLSGNLVTSSSSGNHVLSASVGNLVNKQYDNSSEDKIVDRIDDLKEFLTCPSITSLIDDKGGVLDLSRAPKCEECNKHFLTDHFLAKHKIQAHPEKEVFDLGLGVAESDNSLNQHHSYHQSVLSLLPTAISTPSSLPSIPTTVLSTASQMQENYLAASSTIQLSMSSFLQSSRSFLDNSSHESQIEDTQSLESSNSIESQQSNVTSQFVKYSKSIESTNFPALSNVINSTNAIRTSQVIESLQANQLAETIRSFQSIRSSAESGATHTLESYPQTSQAFASLESIVSSPPTALTQDLGSTQVIESLQDVSSSQQIDNPEFIGISKSIKLSKVSGSISEFEQEKSTKGNNILPENRIQIQSKDDHQRKTISCDTDTNNEGAKTIKMSTDPQTLAEMYVDNVATDLMYFDTQTPVEGEDEKADHVDHDEIDPLLLNVGDHQETTTVYKCEECNLVFRAKSSLTKHRKAEHNLKLKHCCERCGGGFASEQTLKEHISVVHDMIANICYICFKPVNDLMRHVRLQHKRKGERKYDCDICVKSFRTKFACERHKDQVHFMKRPWACQLCEKTFPTKRDVHRHIKIIHFRCPGEGKKEWVCPICETRFTKRGDYDRHKQDDHMNSSDSDLLKFVSYELTRKGKGLQL